ncbi:glutathione S-transferase T2-like [Chenopodium quinoa]|uniref:glutathione S-transferase T2-like n=1 Tax=Chenopodium quinoa TaxID=63459 RepID=UPI000B788E11|nr:glutathione S-transferase T2-like [Chenopodium quinoa]
MKGRCRRDMTQLKQRWFRIMPFVNKFVGCYARTNQLNLSGMTEADLTTEALKLYENENGKKKFQYLHWWNALKNQEKWIQYSEDMANKARPTRQVSPSTPNEVVPTEVRPSGRRATKGKGKLQVFQPSPIVKELANDLKQMKMKKLDLLETIANLKKMEAENEQRKLDYEVLLKDTSGFSSEKKLHHGRFRMTKHVFLRIVISLENHDPFFQLKRDATGRVGLSPLQKCTSAIRMLAYGVAADELDEYFKIAESTTMECLMRFVTGVNELFEEEYLRKPNSNDIRYLRQIGETRGFSGMLGSIDCMHWEWTNSPTE